ncbi:MULTISPECIES: response regulator transcription factor [unclassified Synechococcus]|jgi:DNA-binding NarL/FixJ family response regulator|uniref:response regulator transcription factor n=1 Tax=unclassified Synechococcus TaxID=2626047 RepID=UPI00006950E7|nr:LuxR C-terminal-related transcriptional regulator [Synechococcus sp. JA-2-3B'a(2-13)]ABD02949.1 response regulator [Synechococcus sp. JA-2-3B'a(2-13)]
MSEVESPTAPLKFLIVEDHPEVAQNNCEWLQRIAADAQCITVTNPMDAILRLQREQPDLVVADLLYGQTSGEQSAEPGLEFLRHIFENYPTLNVMAYSSEPLLLTPLVGLISKHQGGFAAVNKMERRTVFLEGAKSALNGELRMPRELRGLTKLTEREIEVLNLLCKEALTDQAIADRIHTSKKTVQNCIQRLKEKLDIFGSEDEINARVAMCMTAVQKKIIQW